jgi:choline monooxygenase
MDDHVRTQGKGTYIGFCTDPLTPANSPLDPHYIPHFPTLTADGGRHKRAIFHALFPNVFYFCLPHSMYTVVCTPDPENPSKSVEYAELVVSRAALALPDADDRIEAMWRFYDMTNDEDLEVCASVQKGTGTYEYRGGRMSYRFEETIHRFQNMLVDYMINKPRIPPGDAEAMPGVSRGIDL